MLADLRSGGNYRDTSNEVREGWVTQLPLVLILVVIALSPMLYDLSGWLRDLLPGG